MYIYICYATGSTRVLSLGSIRVFPSMSDFVSSPGHISLDILNSALWFYILLIDPHKSQINFSTIWLASLIKLIVISIFVMWYKYSPTAINKWQNEITIPNHPTFWEKNTFKLAFLVGHDSWGKIFQFRILHCILATNKKLALYGIKDFEKCDFVVLNQKA